MRIWLAGIVLLFASPVVAQSIADLDRLTGLYRLSPDNVVNFTRQRDRLFVQGAGQPAVALSSSGPNLFGSQYGQWRFEIDAAGTVTRAVLTQYGETIPAVRLSATESAAVRSAWEVQAARSASSPGVETALRRQIAGFAAGMPDYEGMSAGLASVVRKNAAMAVEMVGKQGMLKSLTFQKMLLGGANVFLAEFEHGRQEWIIAPLTQDGRVGHMQFKQL